MLKFSMTKPFLYLFLAGACFNLSAAYAADDNSFSRSTPAGVKPGVSDPSSDTQQGPKKALSRREKIAQLDARDQDIHKRAYRMGDWDYKANWRYDRKAFYNGESQPEAYRDEHPYGPSGIGYDADEYYPRGQLSQAGNQPRRQNSSVPNLNSRPYGNNQVASENNTRPYQNYSTYPYSNFDNQRDGSGREEISDNYNSGYYNNNAGYYNNPQAGNSSNDENSKRKRPERYNR